MTGVIVVLAEPGGGKTELLKNLAHRLGVPSDKASMFIHSTSATPPPLEYLVLDALDEVAKLGSYRIDKIFVKAKETGAKLVIFSSRSSEWEEARNFRIRECFGTDPKVVYLQPFNVDEQKELFSHHMPNEDFAAFNNELGKFDLAPLLGNPQFLKIFADAFVESGRIFTTKKKIFEDAVRHLASIPPNGVAQKDGSTREELIAWANEVFAKLLLSGAVGVDVTDTLEERHFPRLTSLVLGDTNMTSILDTQLFKPSDGPNKHEPVHRIVAEFCAARYLAARIDDNSDLLSSRQCMAIIAPKSVVRDELRGLLGWIAALGNQVSQETAIDLDPYAVLANGDPSQLSLSSRKRLLAGLQRVVAEGDLFFRRADVWRTFSASGFFTGELVDELRPLLTGKEENGDLRGLLLELLEGSDAIAQLAPELRILMLEPDCSAHIRALASRCLISMTEHSPAADCKALISEGSKTSLKIAAELYKTFGIAKFGRGDLLDLFRESAKLYPGQNDTKELVLGERFFVKQLIQTLELKDVEWLLDELTNGLHCTCGAKNAYECDCRNGVSKIVGSLLDRYFEQNEGPYEPARVWGWIENLNFRSQISAEQSASVRALQTNHGLRQSLQHLVLDHSQLHYFVSAHSQLHSGLNFQHDDFRAVVDYAFETDNPDLWYDFIATHKSHGNADERGPDELRRHMREQAREKPAFMKVWARRNHEWKKPPTRELERKLRQSERKSKRKKRAVAKVRAKNLNENRDLIESGRHFDWLFNFAKLYLSEPYRIPEEFDDALLLENALRKCLPFIEPRLPSLQELAKIQCASINFPIKIITLLYAACLAIFRKEGHLECMSPKALSVLKTTLDIAYRAIKLDEKELIEKEINRLLFNSVADVERFAKEYIEPQLQIEGCQHPKVCWLNYKKEFAPLRAQYSLDWLKQYPDISLQAMDTLFALSASYADRSKLQNLIVQRCDEFLSSWPDKTDDEKLEEKRRFWFLRHFFFINDEHEAIWPWLTSDKNTIFDLEYLTGDLHSKDNVDGFPDLSAAKIYYILDAFIEKWPKVDLPNIYGSGSPKAERAYRFLTEIIGQVDKDSPERSLLVLDRILSEPQFGDFHIGAQDLRVSAKRKFAHQGFVPPPPADIVAFLAQKKVVSVEGLRALLIDALEELQQEINGSEFDPVEKFYDGEKRVDENTASKRIAEHLQLRLKALSMAVTIEHQLKNRKRCDITVTAMCSGSNELLAIEVKGQWNRELFTAAKEQLYERYSSHPNAEQQGIYLVLWFGNDEKIAGKKDATVSGPDELKQKVVESIPKELKGLIDVFVLDLSRK